MYPIKMEENKKQKDIFFKRNMFWNLVGATSNAFTSLLFMIIVTRINGIEESGVFTIAFSLACLICIVGGYQGRVFQVTDVKKQFNDKEYILHRYMTFALMMVLALIYTFIQGYSFYKTSITILLCLLKGLEVLADVYYGIMQKNGVLYQAGFSLTIKSVVSILFFYVVDLMTGDLLASTAILCLIWLIIFIFYDLPKVNHLIDKNDRIDIKNTLKIFKEGFFAFAILFLSVYLVNAPKYALDTYVNSQEMAIFGIIIMPATLLSLCAQYVLQPFLPRLSHAYGMHQFLEFKKSVRFLLLIIIATGIISIIGGYFFGIPILEIVYNVSLDKYLFPFIIILFGASFYALCILLSAVLTTIRKTYQQFIIYIIISLFALFISNVLISQFGLFGAAYSYFLIMLIQFALYYLYYNNVLSKKIKQKESIKKEVVYEKN